MSNNDVTGAEALLKSLRRMGVEKIFASPGSDWAPLWEALAKDYAPGEIPDYVSSRHEETAIGMAMGYWKATGKLPAVVIHTTVGSLHGAMAVRAALHERVPMVVLAGESVGFGEVKGLKVGRQWLRLLTDTGGPARLMEPCVKWSYGLDTASILPHTIQRACQLAVSAPQGPVFVSVPLEILMAPNEAASPQPAVLPKPAAAQAAVIDELAHLLAAANNPIIFTEELGRNPRAVPHLVALAERLGARVLDGWHADYVNFPYAHPLYGGVVAEPQADVSEADVVLLVEAVAPWHPASALPTGSTKVVALGEDPLQTHLPYWGFRTDLVAQGDAEATLAALVERVTALVPADRHAERIARARSRHETARAATRARLAAAAAKPVIETAWVAHELGAVLPRDAIVMNETISHRPEIMQGLVDLVPGQFLETSYGGLGLGLGMALGVKYARPDRPVVMVIGDGALHYNAVIAAFGAVQELGLPMLVVVFDNAGYRSQRRDVFNEFPDGHAVRTGRFAGTAIEPRPEYAYLARAYGGEGERVTEPAAVRGALERGLAQAAGGRLALVHFVLDAINSKPHP